jgi:predicted nucleic acid-binding protein
VLYILDTDVLSDLEKREPKPAVLTWLGALAPDEIATTLSTVFEIQMGIEAARHAHPERARMKEAWLEGLLQARSARIIAPDVEIARLQARMFSYPRLRDFIFPAPNARKPKMGIDLVIAATAIVYGAVVATFNTKDFQRIHEHFPLPGVFHPGRNEFIVPPRQSEPT